MENEWTQKYYLYGRLCLAFVFLCNQCRRRYGFVTMELMECRFAKLDM